MAEQAIEAPKSSPVPSGRLGLWWFLGSEVATFGGLIAAYVLFRFRNPQWAEPASHTWMAAGALNTVVLLTSSLTMVLAHAATLTGQFQRAARLLATTIGLGLAFLVVKGLEYHHEIAHGLTPTAGLFWSFYFGMTGLHALHVFGGVLANTVVWVGLRAGKNSHRVEVVGLYWHFVDVVWIVLFPLLYVASSGGRS